MNVQRQIDRLIARQAVQWYESLKNGAGDRQGDFVRWIAESPRHIEAFLAIASEAAMARGILAGGEFDMSALLKAALEEEKILTLQPACRKAPMVGGINQQRRQWKLLSAAAAAIAAILVAVPIALRFPSGQKIETPVGEQRTIQLPEGSVVNLNARSKVEVRFSEHRREIRLPRGEATFKVARDPSRPFRVYTPGAVVEAVGTQFNVYARPGGVTTVSVLEGKVNVSREVRQGLTKRATQAVPVSAGEEATVQSAGGIERHSMPDVTESIAWQQRKLVFKRTSLSDIAAEFNRYNKTTQIRLEGIQPDAFRFNGAFNADDPQSLATLLMREPDLEVETRDGEIIVRHRNAEDGLPRQ